MQKTYLFYDIETTGLNKCFDQVLQFAAIRTDLALKELERHEFQIRLNSDVIPSPEALIVHRMGISQLQEGENELEALRKIHQLLNTPGTISVGYNTLGFDDEFLRFSFYRNLLSPYTHQYANSCARMDIYPLTLLYYLFKPEIIQWPKVGDVVSMKLEHLSRINNLMKGSAHNAMVDVEATLALARKLQESETLWDFSCAYFHKETDLSRLNKLSGEAILIQGKIGSRDNYLAPVLSLGQHYHYKNQTLWLRLDREELSKTTSDTIRENTYVLRKKPGEDPILLPIQDRYLEKISQSRRELAEENKRWLAANPELLREIQEYHRNFVYPPVPNIDVDAALYEIGFPSREEEGLFLQFHAASPKDKLTIAERIPNKKRQSQAYRILARFYPEYLGEKELMLFEESQNKPQLDFRNEQKLTIKKALEKIAELLSTDKLNLEQIDILKQYEEYLKFSEKGITTSLF